MTKEIFDNILEQEDITWNDIVKITVLNQNYKWYKFWTKKVKTFIGPLNYFDSDQYVEILDTRYETYYHKYINFDFKEVIDIKRIK